MTTQTRFEDRLLEDLQRVVAARPAPADAAPEPRTARRTRRTRLALGGISVAAAVTAVVLVSSSGDVTPSAYAVQPRSDGTITVKIHSLRDAAGLQRSLRAAGVPADVSYIADAGNACPEPPAGPASRGVTSGQEGPTTDSVSDGDGGHASVTESGGTTGGPPPGADEVSTQMRVSEDGVVFTITPGEIKPGKRLVIATSDGTVSSIGTAIVADGAEAPCFPPPTAAGR